MGKILKYKGWNLLDTGYFPSEKVKDLFDAIQSGKFNQGQFLKNHHRSKVRRFHYEEKELVVKTPLEKNQRHWIRFTTLFRSGEAFKNIQGMELLADKNIPSTVPVMAAECRRSGVVTDSWLVYEFLEGTSCFGHARDLPDVVKRLQSMHEKGLLHGDSQLQNFLNVEGTIHVIDANPSSYWNSFRTTRFITTLPHRPGVSCVRPAPGACQTQDQTFLWLSSQGRLDYLCEDMSSPKSSNFMNSPRYP